jgi:hypothetical protein
MEEISPEQRRRDWLNRIAEEIDKIECFSTEWTLPDDGGPPWVANVEREFARAMFPVAKLKTSKVLTPRLIGAILGHQCAYAVWLMEWLSTQIEAANSPAEESLTEDEVLKAEPFHDSFAKWYSALRRLAKLALCSNVDQSYGDMSEFLLAYAAGFAKKPGERIAGDIGGTTFEIYLFLLMYWRVVEQFKSVSQLHEVLRKVLGENRTGDLKRIEKLCQRIGLHFRKPGRPPKSK